MTMHLTIGTRAMAFDSDDWLLQAKLNSEGTKHRSIKHHVQELARRDAHSDIQQGRKQTDETLATFPPAYRRSYLGVMRREWAE